MFLHAFEPYFLSLPVRSQRKLLMTKFLLHFAKPSIVAPLALHQLRHSLDAYLWTTPEQRLPVGYCWGGLILSRGLDEVCWDVC